jgi:DNA replication and repair protein RecF
MYIEELGVSNVRNLSNVTVKAEPGINFFFGENAAGKTAILEAIHLVSRTKSFRNPRIKDILQYGEDVLTVTTALIDGDKRIVTGLKKNKSETHLKYDGVRVAKASEQARNIPLFVITSESHKILNGNPKERRHWLDWAMFHVEPNYMETWQQYYLALRHRNALLRQRAKEKEFEVWEEIMVKTAKNLADSREKYIKNVKKRINKAETFPFSSVEIKEKKYTEKSLSNYLAQERKTDLEAGYTRSGPHRTDIIFYVDGQIASKALSRGQAKLFLIFLISAQAIEFIDKNNRDPVLLVDDIAAELDTSSLNKALHRLSSLKLQIFINSVHQRTAESISDEITMFHVERGKVAKMIE